MRSVLMWHVPGSWTESFVAGRHRYLIPVNDNRDDYGRRLCGRNWPRAQEILSWQLQDADIDLVVLQRPREIALATRWLGRRPDIDIPAVYVEHNTPRPFAVDSVHPLAGRDDIPVIHVTDVNRLMWDSGAAPTRVINHGIADPGHRYTGEIPAAATTINEPCRRWRTVGADFWHRPCPRERRRPDSALAAAAAAGKPARDFAIAHFALGRFLSDWDDVIDEHCG